MPLPDAGRFEALRSQGEELGRRRQIPIGIADVCMTEIGGQLWQALLDVVAAAVPMEQGPDGEAMALLQNGYDIRTVKELLGHKDVKTTMVYTHVLNRGGRGVISPLESVA